MHEPKSFGARGTGPLRDVDVALLRERLTHLSERLSDEQILSLSRALNTVLTKRRRDHPPPLRLDIRL